MKVGFTGSQSGMTLFQREALKELLLLKNCTEFVHGDTIGADEQANEIAFDVGIRIFTIFPPKDGKKRAWCFNPTHDSKNDNLTWNKILYKDIEIQVRWMPKDDYLSRNRHIVDNVEYMISAPKEFEHTIRSGTWATVRYIWKSKRDTTNIPPVDRERI